MKILHVINSLATGGAEKLLLESLPIYNQKKILSDLLLLNGTQQPFLDELDKKKCCSIFKLSKGSVYNPLLIFKIIPYLKKYDIVHVHLFPALYWVALAKIISFSNVKLVYTEHNTNNRRRRLSVFKMLDKYFYGIYSKIIAITDEVKNLLLVHLDNKHSKNISVVHNGINLDLINDAIPYKKTNFFSDEDCIICIQVARFHPQKNQKTAIEAIQLLPYKYKLLLVGEGELKKECEEVVLEKNLDDRILFLGNRNDVAQLLKTGDFVLLSSNFEGLSLSCIEGLASGKPFIASKVPGLIEIVDGSGVLFENNNYNELSKIILDISNDKSEYDAIAKRGIQRAGDFSIHKMIKSYSDLYKELKN